MANWFEYTMQGNIAAMKAIRSSFPNADVDARLEVDAFAGATALYLAVASGQLAAVEYLLSIGANPNAAHPATGRFGGLTALQLAARVGKPEIAELLKRHGASG